MLLRTLKRRDIRRFRGRNRLGRERGRISLGLFLLLFFFLLLLLLLLWLWFPLWLLLWRLIRLWLSLSLWLLRIPRVRSLIILLLLLLLLLLPLRIPPIPTSRIPNIPTSRLRRIPPLIPPLILFIPRHSRISSRRRSSRLRRIPLHPPPLLWGNKPSRRPRGVSFGGIVVRGRRRGVGRGGGPRGDRIA